MVSRPAPAEVRFIQKRRGARNTLFRGPLSFRGTASPQGPSRQELTG